MPRTRGSESPMASNESMASITVPVMSPSATGVCWSGVAMLELLVLWGGLVFAGGVSLKDAPKEAFGLWFLKRRRAERSGGAECRLQEDPNKQQAHLPSIQIHTRDLPRHVAHDEEAGHPSGGPARALFHQVTEKRTDGRWRFLERRTDQETCRDRFPHDGVAERTPSAG